MIVGIFTAAAADRIRGTESRACTGPFWDCDALSVAVFPDGGGRPLSAAAHELGHLLGRQHASAACGAEDAQDWPPDQQGFIQGVGLDRRTGRVIFPDRSGGSLGAPVYDFMGYCGQNGNYDPDKWISVRGWNDTLRALATGYPGSQSSFQASVRSLLMKPSTGQQLIVHALHSYTGDFSITKVAPGHAAFEELQSQSDYRLLVRDENDATLREVGMRSNRIHSENGADSQLLIAKVTVPDVRRLGSVEIAYRGQLVAKRVRSKEVPVIGGVVVTPDCKTDRGRRTMIKWQATHAERKSLLVKIDFSPDAGKSWRPVFFGPNASEIALESSLLSRSCEAMLRLRVSDGFNESHAYSSCFSAAGRAPLVRIKSPAECAQIKCGASIYLSGEAYDDEHRPITGKRLVWTIGKCQVATGATAAISGLQPGTHKVKLTATDEHKRSTTKKIRLNVLASGESFIASQNRRRVV